MRNRHRPGWRFLRFTMIVTVKAPICNVIRMASPPFRVVWLTAFSVWSSALPSFYLERPLLSIFAADRRGFSTE